MDSALEGSRLDLPAHADHKDFVEGALHFGDQLIGIDFEYSLSYLQLRTDQADALLEILKRIRPILTTAPDAKSNAPPRAG
jgi:hypothetical protein